MKKTGKIITAVMCIILAGATMTSCGGKDLTFDKIEFTAAAPTAEFTVAEYNTYAALAGYPVLIGGMAHGKEFVQTLSDLGLGNFVWIPKYDYPLGYNVWNEENWYEQDVSTAVANGMYYLVSHKRGLGDDFKKGGYLSGGDTAEIVPNSLADLAIIANAGKDANNLNYFVGYHAEELDADLYQNARLAFGDRIPEIMNYTTNTQARINFETELQRMQRQANEMGGNFAANMLVSHHLNAFRAGSNIVLAELLEHTTNTNLQLAYLRGGANQFGNSWGVWVSPWYQGQVPAADVGLFDNDYASLTGGHKTSTYKKAIWESYVSGADLITNQETEPLFARDIDNGGYKTVLWGNELKNLYDYVKQYEYDEVTPANSVAIMVDRDCGWEPGRLFNNWYVGDKNWAKLGLSDGDKMLAEYLDVFFPGYARTVESVNSRSDLYPGYFSSTPYGSPDIVATDISAERLSKYGTVIMLGDIQMNDLLNDTLRKYVRQGGTLVINAYQSMKNSAFYEDPDLYGYRFSRFDGWKISDRLVSASVIKTTNTGLTFMSEDTYTSDYFFAVNGIMSGGDVLAYEQSTQNPVLVKNRYGTGTVYLTLTEWMMTANAEDSIGFYRDFLSAVVMGNNAFVKTAPADADGTTDYSWQASYRTNSQNETDLLVLLTSYDNADGYVTVTVSDEIDVSRICVDYGVYSDIEVSVNNGSTVIKVKLKADDVTLLKIKDL